MGKIKILYQGDLRTLSIHGSGAEIQTVAPTDHQGKGDCFSPTDLLALSLGSCVLTLMGIAAKRLGVDLTGATASVEKEMSLDAPRRISRILVQVHSPLQVSQMQREKMEQAAFTCPVKESLHPAMELTITFAWGPKMESNFAIQQ